MIFSLLEMTLLLVVPPCFFLRDMLVYLRAMIPLLGTSHLWLISHFRPLQHGIRLLEPPCRFPRTQRSLILTAVLQTCNVPLHHRSGPRLKPLPRYPQPAPRAKLSVRLSTSRYVIVPFFPIVITCSIMSLFPSFPLSHASIVHSPIVFS